MKISYYNLQILLAIHDKNERQIANLCPHLTKFKHILDYFLDNNLILFEYKKGDQLVFVTKKGIDLLRQNKLILSKQPKQPKVVRLDYNYDDYIKAAFKAGKNESAYILYQESFIYRTIIKIQIIAFYIIYKYILKKEIETNAKTQKDPKEIAPKNKGTGKNP